MLLFTPELCGEDPLAVLEASLEHVDVVQVRAKPLGSPTAQSGAREAFEWSARVLERVGDRALVLVDDRVDVAGALPLLDGVHLGERDTPGALARELLGAERLIGLSTHSLAAVVRAEEEPVDYLGFGPIFPTPTKGLARGLGPEAAWVAAQGSTRPLFPIGGIGVANADELAPIGRAALSSAILTAPDPMRAAAQLAEALAGTGD